MRLCVCICAAATFIPFQSKNWSQAAAAALQPTGGWGEVGVLWWVMCIRWGPGLWIISWWGVRVWSMFRIWGLNNESLEGGIWREKLLFAKFYFLKKLFIHLWETNSTISWIICSVHWKFFWGVTEKNILISSIGGHVWYVSDLLLWSHIISSSSFILFSKCSFFHH